MTLDALDRLHGALSSSKWQVRILNPVVEPATGFLLLGIADDLHGGTVGSQLVSHNDMRITVSLH